MKILSTSFFISLCFLFLNLPKSLYIVSETGGSGWELNKELEDIKIFTKEVEDSNLKKLKIEMWFRDATLADIMSVTSDGSTYTDWLYKCVHAENIERMSPLEKIDYFQLDFPWPLSDRDIYNHSVISQNPITRQLTIASEAVTSFASKTDLVRVTDSPTQWHFYPKENGDVFLEYYTAPNPGGNIPDWMVNLVIDKGPTRSMLRLQELVKAQKGKKHDIDWLK